MDCLKVSEVQIRFIQPHDGLLGFATCVVNDQIKIANIALHNRLGGGIRLTFPVKTLKNGQNIPCLHPINQYAEKAFEDAITDKYNELSEGEVIKIG